MYKYASTVEITGIPVAKNDMIFRKTEVGAEVLENLLRAADDVEANNGTYTFNARVLIENQRGRTELFTRTGIDINRLTEMFRWSLTAWISLGSRFGRPCYIGDGDIPGLVSTLHSKLQLIEKFAASTSN